MYTHALFQSLCLNQNIPSNSFAIDCHWVWPALGVSPLLTGLTIRQMYPKCVNWVQLKMQGSNVLRKCATQSQLNEQSNSSSIISFVRTYNECTWHFFYLKIRAFPETFLKKVFAFFKESAIVVKINRGINPSAPPNINEYWI